MGLRLSSSWLLCIGFGAAQARNVNVPEAKPEAVGFSSERLKRLDAGMKAIVDNKQLAGVATMVTRHGQIVQQMTYGQQDIASNSPLQKDTIVRIYSMTKPITGVAMMILYEEGKWKPTDPIARYIPEFKDLKVFKSLDADGKPVARRAGPRADDGRADVAHRRLHLRPVRQLAGRQDVPAGEPARARRRCRNSSTRSHRCRSRTSRARAGCTASASTSRATWWRSCRASRSRTSCASASSSRSA